MQKTLTRGSQNALNRTMPDPSLGKERPMSAYIAQGQQPGAYPSQQLQQQQLRSQSSRDIIRQEAKLQEMQEEVRRRELRGVPPPNQLPGGYRTNTYNPRAAGPSRPPGRPLGSTPNLGPTSPNYGRQPGQNYGYLPPDAAAAAAAQQYGQFNRQQQQPYAAGGGAISRQNGQQFANGPAEADQYGGVGMSRSHTDGEIAGESAAPPARPALPHSSASPPPPVPNTMTHPLYTTKQLEPPSR